MPPVSSLSNQRPLPTRPAAAPARPTMVEADVSTTFTADGLMRPNGDVKLDNGFMTRLVKHVLRNPKTFRDIQVRFDKPTGTFVATGKFCLKGVWLPATASVRVLVDQNRPSFRFEDVHVPLPMTGKGVSGAWLTQKVTEAAADALKQDGILAGSDAPKGVVRLSLNGLMPQIGGVPKFVLFDEQNTRFGLNTSPDGDLDLTMASQGQGPARGRTAHSDIALSADDQSLAGVLRTALDPGYRVQDVQIRPGGLTVHGTTEYTPVSEAATQVVALFRAIVTRNVNPPIDEQHVWGPLDLDVSLDGTKAVIKPSLEKAVGTLADTLRTAGMAPDVQPDGIHVDLAPWLASKGIVVNNLAVSSHQLSASLDFDLDSRIKNPNLRP